MQICLERADKDCVAAREWPDPRERYGAFIYMRKKNKAALNLIKLKRGGEGNVEIGGCACKIVILLVRFDCSRPPGGGKEMQKLATKRDSGVIT